MGCERPTCLLGELGKPRESYRAHIRVALDPGIERGAYLRGWSRFERLIDERENLGLHLSMSRDQPRRIRAKRRWCPALADLPTECGQHDKIQQICDRLRTGDARVGAVGLMQLPAHQLPPTGGNGRSLPHRGCGVEHTADVLIGEAHRLVLEILLARTGDICGFAPRHSIQDLGTAAKNHAIRERQG